MSNRSIYRKIAKQHGVSVAEVKSEMQAAVDAAWNNPNKTPEQAALQKKFAPDGSAPSADDFIRAVSSDLKTKK